MKGMFYGASAFNGDISSFYTSKATFMSRMFEGASAFNGDISSFDTSKVTDIEVVEPSDFFFSEERFRVRRNQK